MLKSIPSGSGVIINWRCSGAPERVPKQFYYPNGDIVGSLAYWYNRPIRELWVSNYHYENKEEQDIQYVYSNLQLNRSCADPRIDRVSGPPWKITLL